MDGQTALARAAARLTGCATARLCLQSYGSVERDAEGDADRGRQGQCCRGYGIVEGGGVLVLFGRQHAAAAHKMATNRIRDVGLETEKRGPKIP